MAKHSAKRTYKENQETLKKLSYGFFIVFVGVIDPTPSTHSPPLP